MACKPPQHRAGGFRVVGDAVDLSQDSAVVEGSSLTLTVAGEVPFEAGLGDEDEDRSLLLCLHDYHDEIFAKRALCGTVKMCCDLGTACMCIHSRLKLCLLLLIEMFKCSVLSRLHLPGKIITWSLESTDDLVQLY